VHLVGFTIEIVLLLIFHISEESLLLAEVFDGARSGMVFHLASLHRLVCRGQSFICVLPSGMSELIRNGEQII